MFTKKLLVVLVLLGLTHFGYAYEASTSTLDGQKTVVVMSDQEFENYKYNQKKEFLQRMRVELKAMQKDAKDMVTQSKTSKVVRENLKNELARVNKNLKKLKKEIELVERSDETTWEEVKRNFHSSYLSVKSGIVKSRTWLSEKIEP